LWAWQPAFEDAEHVEAVQDDYFVRPAVAMVSPANSFGIMGDTCDPLRVDHSGGRARRSRGSARRW
jgi:hypothetical protein